MWRKIIILILVAYNKYTNCQEANSQFNSEPVDFINFTPTSRFKLTADNLENINKDIPTVFLVHGWYTSVSIDLYLLNITIAYSDLRDRNVIYVDWSSTAQNSYTGVVWNGAQSVGNKVGEMIMLLHDRLELDVKMVQIIGVTLGAHIAGYAGRYVQNKHPGNASIGRITGLEASGDLFDRPFGFFNNPNALRSSDADIVDVTHTNSLFFGSGENAGTVDFYVNGGQTQRFCGNSSYLDYFSPTLVNTCSHAFAIILYRLAIGNENYIASSGPDKCVNTVVYGDKLDRRAKGVYYIDTEDDWPYKTKCSNINELI